MFTNCISFFDQFILKNENSKARGVSWKRSLAGISGTSDRRRRAAGIGAAAGLIMAIAPSGFAHAQSTDASDAVAKCAALAASNAEAGVTTFVVRERLRPSVALEPCRIAVEKNPGDIKTRYRLSRVQFADNDKKAAFESARIAAEGGYGPAMYNLALMYSGGDGVDADQTKALNWLLKAAERENDIAPTFRIQTYLMIARNYHLGTAAAKDIPSAVKWFARAAALNDPEAMAQMGYYYLQGIGVAKDEKRAADFTLRAARAGSCVAAYNAGIHTYNGFGVPASKQEARRWYAKAKDCPTSTAANVKTSEQMIARIDKEMAPPPAASSGEKLAEAVVGGIILYNKLKSLQTGAIYLTNNCYAPARFAVRYYNSEWKFAWLSLKPGEQAYVVDASGKKIAHQIDHRFFTSGYGLKGNHKWGGKVSFQTGEGTLYMREQEIKPDKDGDLALDFSCGKPPAPDDDDDFPF
jgi:TPR repeat protein